MQFSIGEYKVAVSGTQYTFRCGEVCSVTAGREQSVRIQIMRDPLPHSCLYSSQRDDPLRSNPRQESNPKVCALMPHSCLQSYQSQGSTDTTNHGVGHIVREIMLEPHQRADMRLDNCGGMLISVKRIRAQRIVLVGQRQQCAEVASALGAEWVKTGKKYVKYRLLDTLRRIQCNIYCTAAVPKIKCDLVFVLGVARKECNSRVTYVGPFPDVSAIRAKMVQVIA